MNNPINPATPDDEGAGRCRCCGAVFEDEVPDRCPHCKAIITVA